MEGGKVGKDGNKSPDGRTGLESRRNLSQAQPREKKKAMRSQRGGRLQSHGVGRGIVETQRITSL